MQMVRLNDLSDPVRAFLAPAGRGEVIVVQDEGGKATYSVVPIIQPSVDVQRQAWSDILKLQQEVGNSMRQHGASEEDIDRLLLEN
ncbi:MAG: hypothetical protein WCJ35_24385 [Planctomycetota bacterium]